MRLLLSLSLTFVVGTVACRTEETLDCPGDSAESDSGICDCGQGTAWVASTESCEKQAINPVGGGDSGVLDGASAPGDAGIDMDARTALAESMPAVADITPVLGADASIRTQVPGDRSTNGSKGPAGVSGARSAPMTTPAPVQVNIPDALIGSGPTTMPTTASTPPRVCVIEAEICDGKDNNCNGQVDEGWALKIDAATSSSPFGGGAMRPTVNRWAGSRCYQPCVGSPSYSVRGKFQCDVAKREMVCGSLENGCVPMATPYGDDDPPGLVATYPVRD